VYNLVTHAEKRPAKDFLHRTLMALFLLRCLQEAHFFETNKNESKMLHLHLLSSGSVTFH
jgi:hypothetical protein